MLKAAIFDLDGLLVDSEPIWRQVEIEIFGRLGLNLTEADCIKTMGYRIDAVVSYWYKVLPWQGPSCAEVQSHIIDKFIEVVKADCRPMPGALAAMQLLKSYGVRIAIASSSSAKIISAVIQGLRVSEIVEVFCSAEQEAKGKPDPAVYLTTLRKLKLNAAECIAFEDSPVGLEAAVAAGLRCVCVPSEGANLNSFSSASLMLNSLDKFNADHLKVFL